MENSFGKGEVREQARSYRPVGRNKAAAPAVSGNALGAGNAPLNAPLIPAYSYYRHFSENSNDQIMSMNELILDSPSFRATLIGGGAVLLWSLLALLTTQAKGVPPFQLVAMAFTVAFLVSGLVLALRGSAALAALKQRPAVWLLGVGGLFGYHFFYFVALGNAPPVDANLINYLWPLLIVVFSALLPGERLRWYHLGGALMGLAGTSLLVTKGGTVAFRTEYLPGYLAALACAFTWSGYSVLNRRFGETPTDVVAGYCGIVAVLGFLCHALLEQTVILNGSQWLAVLGLGLGPMGAAFFLWDYGTKHGRIQILGAFSYAAPLLSTLLLLAFGKAEASWIIGAACALIVGGALLASRELLSGYGRG